MMKSSLSLATALAMNCEVRVNDGGVVPLNAVDDGSEVPTRYELGAAVVVCFEHDGVKAEPEKTSLHKDVGFPVCSAVLGGFKDVLESGVGDDMLSLGCRHGGRNGSEDIVDLLDDVVDVAVDVELPRGQGQLLYVLPKLSTGVWVV